jgi:membrane protease YdiL (CAAX protease family)
MQGKPLDRVLILNITIVVEALLLLAATLWCQFCEIELLPLMHLNHTIVMIGLAAGMTVAASGFVVLWLCGKLADRASWLADLKSIINDELTPLFQSFNAADILLVAACSGFCEEVFFRGVLQVQLGLLPAAVLFGFFHCPSRRYLPYCLWAVCAGLFLGWMLALTNSLWTPVLAHSSSNFLVLLYLRYRHKAVKSDDSPPASQEAARPEIGMPAGGSKIGAGSTKKATSAQASKVRPNSAELNQSSESKDD